MAPLEFVGWARVGIDEDLCEIYYDDDDDSKLWAKNPMGEGYNWVSTGSMFRPFTGRVYSVKGSVPARKLS